jgi:putative ABC transport system permease protein
VLAPPHQVSMNGRSGTEYRSDEFVPLFLATPELLAHYGIDPAGIAADADILSVRTDLGAFDLAPGRDAAWRPKIQQVDLPAFSSLPTALITQQAMRELHRAPITAGWLVETPAKPTAADIDRAERAAGAAGLTVESRPTGADVARLADYATAAGIAVALGVLATTVGLIRSETARDLRTLAAAGARRRTRRTLTAATAGALALLGAVLGTLGAYLALLAWYHRDPHWLGHLPMAHLAAILVGLPVVAFTGAWLLAGREPPLLARQPME